MSGAFHLMASHDTNLYIHTGVKHTHVFQTLIFLYSLGKDLLKATGLWWLTETATSQCYTQESH